MVRRAAGHSGDGDGMKWSSKPVIVVGHGVRASGADITPLLSLGVPILSSWQAMDLIDNFHPIYFGRPGIFGQRTANKILYEADQIVAIGNRMTPWQIGHAGLRPEQELIMVDVDGAEAARFPQATWINEDAKDFIPTMLGAECPEWLRQCNEWRDKYPWIEYPTHNDGRGFMNSYRIMSVIERHLPLDAVITVDIGSHMCSLFQGLHVKPPQRVICGGGLGEMGCALPYAIGASFARGKGEVLCLVGDGGLMLNLQELQTMVHHKLPIKIIVFENDGYAMIKGTHKNMNKPYTGVTKASGISMPDFCDLAAAMKINTCTASNWELFQQRIKLLFQVQGPFLMVVHLDPEQIYMPRLQPTFVDGKIIPPKFSDLSPIL